MIGARDVMRQAFMAGWSRNETWEQFFDNLCREHAMSPYIVGDATEQRWFSNAVTYDTIRSWFMKGYTRHECYEVAEQKAIHEVLSQIADAIVAKHGST